MRRRNSGDRIMLPTQMRWPAQLLEEAGQLAKETGVERAEILRVATALGMRHLIRPIEVVGDDEPPK